MPILNNRPVKDLLKNQEYTEGNLWQNHDGKEKAVTVQF